MRGMAKLRKLKVLTLAFLLLLTGAFFQNCSPSKVNFQQSQVPSTAAQNNGHGYTGKATYVLRDTANECSDASGIKTRVDLSVENVYYLVRENCAEISDVVISAPATTGADANRPDSIIYKGQTLTRAPELSPRDGYFVMSQATYDGALGGLAGANAKCLGDLQANDWRGKTQAMANGQLTSAGVTAFLCDGANCQNAAVHSTYVYARAGLAASGGSSFTANFDGHGPGDTLNWDDSDTFSADLFTWTGRASVSSSIWGGADVNHCGAWSSNAAGDSGRDGSTNFTTNRRWDNATVQCSSVRHLLCLVHP